MSTATLLCSCQDRTGIVASLSDFVFRHGGNVVDLDQHSEPGPEGDRFFMRLVWSLDRFALDRESIADQLRVLAKAFGLNWEIRYDDRPPRVAIFCSKEAHCLYDLLLREQMGELGGEIVAVIANHETLRDPAGHFGKPFYFTPTLHPELTAVEAQQAEILARYEVDLVVLAKYMRIVSPEFCARWAGRCLNIHHSFLPAFAGARPYHQAKARGVKVIGATAHYVTAELDQGPIIEQDVTRVTHRDDVSDLIRKGRDLERQVLGRAVRLHLAHRVLIDAGRTIVFA